MFTEHTLFHPCSPYTTVSSLLFIRLFSIYKSTYKKRINDDHLIEYTPKSIEYTVKKPKQYFSRNINLC